MKRPYSTKAAHDVSSELSARHSREGPAQFFSQSAFTYLFLPAAVSIELHPYYHCIAPLRLFLSLTVLQLLRIFFKTKELDLSSVEGDISSATSTLFLCLAPADPRPAGSLIPHNVLTHRRKY
ncbi:hypothetical protein MHYP_G00155230 [Metynnis hypsauchen]